MLHSLIPFVLLVTSMPTPVCGREWGVGVGVVSANVNRDAWRSGSSVQPSIWTYAERTHALLTAWSSVSVGSGNLDDLVLDSRAGLPLGSWGWVGGTIHWNWMSPLEKARRRQSLEVGTAFSWFAPAYRPTITLAYETVADRGLLAAVSVPYTVRLGWLLPTTFVTTIVPELAVRSGGRYGDLGIQYLSFTALMELKVRWLTIIPTASVVPKEGLENWLIWGGVHLGAAR